MTYVPNMIHIYPSKSVSKDRWCIRQCKWVATWACLMVTWARSVALECDSYKMACLCITLQKRESDYFKVSNG